MAKALVWFRNDLRTHDHPALHQAMHAHDAVLGVFCLEPTWFEYRFDGVPKKSALQWAFLHDSLVDLASRLSVLNVPLFVKFGRPEDVIRALAEQYDVGDLYVHDLPGHDEKKALKAVRNVSQLKHHVLFEKTLLHPDDLPFPLEALPEVFTQFRKAVESTLAVRPALPVPLKQRDLGITGVMETDAIEARLPNDQAVHRRFKGGEGAGLDRLKHYSYQTRSLARYKETRNGLLYLDDSSKWSPYLAHGCLSVRHVYETIRKFERSQAKNDSTTWMIYELLWRDYFSFIHMRHGNQLFKPGGLKNLAIDWHADAGWFTAWTEGRTGYPLVDAAMRELKTTGFMSNRARQNAASFLTKNLGIDWRLGAAWFEAHLIDHDVSSNYGNWNYVAGVGNDARDFRFFNVIKQGQTYDPKGAYAKFWLKALKDVPSSHIYTVHTLPEALQVAYGCVLGEDYPTPLVDLFKSAARQKARYLEAAEIARRKRGDHDGT